MKTTIMQQYVHIIKKSLRRCNLKQEMMIWIAYQSYDLIHYLDNNILLTRRQI